MNHLFEKPATIVLTSTLFLVTFQQISNAFFLPIMVVKVNPADKPYEIKEPTLKHAKDVARVDKHQVLYFSNPAASHPNFAPILSITFPPPISRRQFRRLKKLYSKWSPTSCSVVKYNKTKAKTEGYDILDVLPPIMQATWGHRFQPEDELGPAPLHYQCYGFLLDALQVGSKRLPLWKSILTLSRPRQWIKRGYHFLKGKKDVSQKNRLTISTPDSRSVFEALLNKTTLIAEGFNVTNSYGEDDGIQPGDVILIYHDNTGKWLKNEVWLDHMIMFVDEGLLFEKSGSGEGTTFRLVDYGTFEKSWATPLGLFRMQVRRPNPRNAVNIVRDLTLEGTFSLPEVQQVAQEKEDLPGSAKGLCGSYVDESKRVLYTTVANMKEAMRPDPETKRAKLPKRAFQPFLAIQQSI